ncbi:hypothetical protein AB0B79_36695 [Streptomyces sp. NPDC039022]|uniref:hypothetical protein n=1 Tax=unclassified Streptomyces TaxID=2593676 RepID=UPI0033F558B0
MAAQPVRGDTGRGEPVGSEQQGGALAAPVGRVKVNIGTNSTAVFAAFYVPSSLRHACIRTDDTYGRGECRVGASSMR